MTCPQPLALGSDSSGIADDEFGIDDDFSADFALFAVVPHDVLKNDMSDLFARNVYCGKGRRAEFGELDIVKTRDGNIPGNLQSFLAQFPHHADGHEIINAKNPSGAKA